MYGNRLWGPIPPELGSVKTLEFVGFAQNNLDGTIPPEVASLPKLEYLLLNNNMNINGEIPSNLLVASPDLEVVDLSGNSLTGPFPSEGLPEAALTRLTYIDFSYNMLVGNIPTEISGLVNLTWLSIEENAMTGSLDGLCKNSLVTVSATADSCGVHPAVDCTCCDCPPP